MAAVSVKRSIGGMRQLLQLQRNVDFFFKLLYNYALSICFTYLFFFSDFFFFYGVLKAIANWFLANNNKGIGIGITNIPVSFHVEMKSYPIQYEHLVFILQQRLAQNPMATLYKTIYFQDQLGLLCAPQLQKPRLLTPFQIASPIRYGFSAAARAIRWIVDIAMTFSERGCLLHFVNISNYKFLFGIELNF